MGSVHVSPEAARGKDGGSPVLDLIASLYVILIVLVVGGMFLHNALDFLKKIRRKLAQQQGLVAEEPVAPPALPADDRARSGCSTRPWSSASWFSW